MGKLALSKYVDLRQPLPKVLLDIGNRVPIANSQQDVHGVFRAEAHVPGGIAVKGEQKRDAEESSVPFDLALDAGTMTIYLDFCGQRGDVHLFAIAYVVENRLRRCLSRRFRYVGHWKTLANIGICANQSDHLLRAIGRAVDSKSHAHSTSFHHSRYAGSHFPNAAFQSSSKLKGLHTPRRDPDVGIARIDKPRCGSQKASQETALKDHQEHGKTHTQYR